MKIALLILATAAFAQRAPVEPPLRPLQQVGGYLLFDVIFHEQLNKQRRALMFFLDLALKLKRTLCVSPLVWAPRWRCALQATVVAQVRFSRSDRLWHGRARKTPAMSLWRYWAIMRLWTRPSSSTKGSAKARRSPFDRGGWQV